jgi:outer membrane protein OmpA-like peptidoglycan-associated protein
VYDIFISRRILPLLLVILSSLHNLQAQPDGRINLGSKVNSGFSELNPVITSDDLLLFFTRKGDTANFGFSGRPDDEDIWYSFREADGTWGKANLMAGPLNTEGYDGVRAVNKSVTRLYLQNQYFADGRRKKGFSVSELGSDGMWQFPTPLDIANYYNDTTTATMAVSNDENVLIMALKRKDSQGGHDLYVSFKTGTYSFSEPKRIDQLSTTGDEVAPFIGFEDQTIYLPSTGFGSPNGLHDIYVMHRLDDTWMNWSKPERLPEPLNSPSSDFYFTLTAAGDTAYISSWDGTSKRGFGKSDIWKAALPKEYRPGTFMPRPQGMPEDDAPAVGALIRLDNVFFDVNKATLRPESHEALEKLRDLLNRYPSMEIEIQGHTDSDGDEAANLALSENRAKSVVKHLIDEGTAAPRLSAKGFGESQPIAPNTTKAGKQLNRRVMVLIKGYGYKGGN